MSASFEFMQVINLTPDSFSDGGKYNSCTGLEQRIEEAIIWHTSYLDIGAQSTAPMNNPIDEFEELGRFEKYLLPVLVSQVIPPSICISIDTYRPSVFAKVYGWIKEYLPYNQVIFNDISGVLDSELIDLMKRYPDFRYVCCHTGLKERAQSGHHMNYVIDSHPDEIINVVRNHFFNSLHVYIHFYLFALPKPKRKQNKI